MMPSVSGQFLINPKYCVDVWCSGSGVLQGEDGNNQNRGTVQNLHKLLCGDFNDVLLGLLASNLEITITTHIYTTCRSAGDGRFINSTRRRAKVESFPGYERTQGTPPPPPPADWK